MAVIDHDVPPESFTEKRTITAFHARHCEAPMRIREPGEIKVKLRGDLLYTLRNVRRVIGRRARPDSSAPPFLLASFRFEPMTRNFETFRLFLISNSMARCAARLFVCLFTDVTASPVATMKRLHASPCGQVSP